MHTISETFRERIYLHAWSDRSSKCESQISWVEEKLKAQYTLLVKLLDKEFIFMPGQIDQVSVNLRSHG